MPGLAEAIPASAGRHEKIDFPPGPIHVIAKAIVDSGRTQIIVFGMETHICVYQTVRDLSHVGYRVFVPHDAVCSRDPENLRVGLVLAERVGATVTATETVLFDLLGRAGTPEFKAISALVKVGARSRRQSRRPGSECPAAVVEFVGALVGGG